MPTAYTIGGVQVWLDYVVKGLEGLGWHVTVLLVSGEHSDARKYLREHPFNCTRLVENPTGTEEGRVRALCNSVRAAAPDVVLVVNIVDTYEAIARLRSGGPAPRVVMALHALQSSLYQDLARWSAVLDGVIATNRLSVAAAISVSGLHPSRVHYAPCGVVVPDFHPPENSSFPLRLIFAGRFDAGEKRVLDLPAILRSLDRRGVRCLLKLAGAGPAEVELRKLLADFGERVEFLGVLSEAEMRTSLFRPGAIALVLSPSETGPLFAWEAMANGAALVTSCFIGSGLENSLRSGENCLTFPVGDTEGAAAAIEHLADAQLRKRVAEAGHQMVAALYRREDSVGAWDSALRRIMHLESLPAIVPPTESPDSGRLDRWLGRSRAETLRRVLGLRFRHSEPGSEWPHSHGFEGDPDFRSLLSKLDRHEDAIRPN